MRCTLTFLILLIASLAPASTYYISRTGNDTTGDGSAATPWKTFGKFTSSATTGDTLYAKAGTYTEQDGVSGAVFAPTSASLTVIGYNTTTDTLDGTIGCVILDAGDESLVSGLLSNFATAPFYFSGRYLRFTGGSGSGADFRTNDDQRVILKDCIFDNNAVAGLNGDSATNVTDSISRNNGEYGIYGPSGGVVLRCISYSNGSDGINLSAGYVIGVVSYDNVSDQISIAVSTNGGIMDCTVDGGGLYVGYNITSDNPTAIFSNNIAYNCTTGTISAVNPRGSARNNLYYGNGDDTDGNWQIAPSDITGQDPLFVDAANNDYSLGLGSPALQAGIDVGSIDGITSTSYIDVGAQQAEATGNVIVID